MKVFFFYEFSGKPKTDTKKYTQNKYNKIKALHL